MSISTGRIMVVSLILISALFVGMSLGNPEITVEVPSAPASVGETISLPVILNNDDELDFAGFMITVNNDIEGVTVAMKQDTPIEGGSYFYGENENPLLKVAEFSIEPTTASKIHLFTLDVTVDDATVTDVPLTITLEELISDSQGDIPLNTVKTVDLSGIKLTEGTSMSVTTDEGTSLQPVDTEPTATSTLSAPTVSPTSHTTSPTPVEQSTFVTSPVSTPVEQSTSVSTPVPVSSYTAQPTSGGQDDTSDHAASPGFGIACVLAGLGIAGAVLSRKQKN